MAPRARPALRLAASNAVSAAELSSFDWLYQEFARYVAGTALRLMGPDTEVNDIVQEVFLAWHRTRPTLASRDDARRWMSAVTTRVSRRWLHRRRWRRWVQGASEPAEPGSHESSAEDRVHIERLYAVLGRVSVEQRLAWTLRRLGGERLEDVSKSCGCSPATAKRRIAAVDELVAEVFGDA